MEAVLQAEYSDELTTSFVPAEGPYIHYYFNLPSMATSPITAAPTKSRTNCQKKLFGNSQFMND